MRSKGSITYFGLSGAVVYYYLLHGGHAWSNKFTI